MAKQELYINGKDAYEVFGISLDTSSLSALMTPPSQKEIPVVKNRLKDGSEYVSTNLKIDERQVTLTLVLTAPSEESFFARYELFCEELATGRLNIKTMYQPNTTYKMVYQSCTQFTQFMRGIAKFSLKLVEPNPTDRT